MHRYNVGQKRGCLILAQRNKVFISREDAWVVYWKATKISFIRWNCTQREETSHHGGRKLPRGPYNGVSVSLGRA